MFKTSAKKEQTWLGSISEIVVLLSIVFVIRTVGFGLYQVPTGSMETTMLVGERFFADKLSYIFRAPRQGEIISFNDPLYKYSDNKAMRLFEYYVWGPSNWTKRIIGLPGDRVQGKIEDGKPVVYVNGTKLSEPYLNQYPLIKIWRDNPMMRGESIEKAIRSGNITPPDWRSYDPKVSYADQPFYRFADQEVMRNAQGEPYLIWPDTVDQTPFRNVDEFDRQLGSDEYWLMGDNRKGSKDSRYIGPVKGELIHGRIVFRILSMDSGEGWLLLDLIKHPIEFFKRVRWSRCLEFVH
jgi:signal peptidase I